MRNAEIRYRGGMADALVSKTSARKGVWVQVPPVARMKRVMQTDENGCVPAALSMLTGMSYRRCKSLFPNKKCWDVRGTTDGQLRRVLKRLGFEIRCGERVGKRDAIVLVTSVETWGGSGRHAIFWDAKRQRYLDPYVGRSGQPRHLTSKKYRAITEEKGVLTIMNV